VLQTRPSPRGTISASISKTLHNLTSYLTAQREFISKVKKATTYPLIVVGFAFLVVILMLIWVIPTFRTVFEKINV
jgi:type IV pilus assembly protein PilC